MKKLRFKNIIYLTGFLILTGLSARAVGFFPVKIIEFTAKYAPEDQAVNLHWVTKEERGKVQYIIERSLDSLHFRMIGEAKSPGRSAKRQHYYFYDTHPVGGDMYYRIREIDTGGSQFLTPVRRVYKPITGLELVQVSLSGDGKELNFAAISPDSSRANVLISDVHGRIQASFVMDLVRGANMRSIYTGNLDPGVYFIQINDLNGAGSVMNKFVKSVPEKKPKADSLKKKKSKPPAQ